MKIEKQGDGYLPIVLTLETPQEANLLRRLIGNMSNDQGEKDFNVATDFVHRLYDFLHDELELIDLPDPHISLVITREEN